MTPFNSLSIITLIPAILIFSFVPTLHCARNFIHTNLMISFFLRKVFKSLVFNRNSDSSSRIHFQSLPQGIVFWLATISRWVENSLCNFRWTSGRFPALFLLSELEVTSIYQENERVRLNQLINITNGNQKVVLFLLCNYYVIFKWLNWTTRHRKSFTVKSLES